MLIYHIIITGVELFIWFLFYNMYFYLFRIDNMDVSGICSVIAGVILFSTPL